MPGEWELMNRSAGMQDLSGYDDATAQLDLKRKLRIAQALQEQQMPQGQMVGNTFVAPSWTQGVANMLNKYVGRKTEENALKNYGQAQAERTKKLADLLQGKEVEQTMDYNEAGNMPGITETVRKPYSQQEFISRAVGIMPELGSKLVESQIAQYGKEDTPISLGKGGILVNRRGDILAQNPESEKEQQMFGKVNPQDFTPESLNAFAKSGGKDYSVLKPVLKQQSQGTPSPIGRLYEERDAIAAKNPNDPRLKQYDAMIQKTVTFANQQPYQATNDALDYAAEVYRSTGHMPALGQGSAQLRTQILERAANLNRQEGVSQSEAATNLAAKKATQGTLLQLQKQATMVKAFETNARKNGDMALNLSEKVDRTGSPIFNKWIQAGQKSITGNPDVSAFNAANETFVNEYAKIMSGSMGNTPVSDAARAHAHDMLSTVQTKGQYRAVMDVLKQEMNNRIVGLDEELKATKNMLNPKNVAPSSKASSASGWKIEKVQ